MRRLTKQSKPMTCKTTKPRHVLHKVKIDSRKYQPGLIRLSKTLRELKALHNAPLQKSKPRYSVNQFGIKGRRKLPPGFTYTSVMCDHNDDMLVQLKFSSPSSLSMKSRDDVHTSRRYFFTVGCLSDYISEQTEKAFEIARGLKKKEEK